jgi:uncharacterized protein with ATP-grasp and redox domains
MDEMSPELETALKEADLLITKGQANFYLVHEYGAALPVRNIITILTTKCRYISGILGFSEPRINVVKAAKLSGEMKL